MDNAMTPKELKGWEKAYDINNNTRLLTDTEEEMDRIWKELIKVGANLTEWKEALLKLELTIKKWETLAKKNPNKKHPFEKEWKKFAKDGLSYIKKRLKNTDHIEDTEPLELNKTSHKLLMLYELGILDYLKKEYPQLEIDTNTNMANLIGALLQVNTEIIRKGLTYLNTGNKRDPNSKIGNRKVKSELTKLGIELKRLSDPD